MIEKWPECHQFSKPLKDGSKEDCDTYRSISILPTVAKIFENLICGQLVVVNKYILLVVIYINDLPRCLKTSTPAMYLDDTNITVVGKTGEEIEQSSNSELENIHKWLLANKLTLKVNKTEYMVIGSSQKLQNTLMNI